MLGIEITENVALNDGKPAFLNMGVHHAREWPAGEHDDGVGLRADQRLQGRRRARDATSSAAAATSSCRSSTRTASTARAARRRSADGERRDASTTPSTSPRAPGEYRRKNCRVGDTETAFCPVSVGLAENGVDPNRNYGQFWGGPGSDTNPVTQTYRGPAPFSEPESRNIQWLVSRNQVTTLITNHTTAGPRAARARPGRGRRPGRREPRLQGARRRHGQAERLLHPEGLRALRHHGHDRGLELQRHRRLRLHVRDLLRRARTTRPATATTPPSTRATRRWPRSGTARAPQADHVGDPGPTAGFDGKGNREAYYLAAESTIDEARHSVLEGTAPAGTRLRLTKDFKTDTFEGASAGRRPPRDGATTSAPSGTFRWHVNPSTRPVVAKAPARRTGGAPSRRAAAPATAGPMTAATRRRLRAASTTTRSRVPRPGGDNARRDVPRRVGDDRSATGTSSSTGTRNGDGAVDRRRAESSAPPRRARRTSSRSPRPNPTGSVRAARDQLRGGRGLHA